MHCFPKHANTNFGALATVFPYPPIGGTKARSMVEHPKSWPLVPDAADSSGWGVVGQTHTSKDANAAWRICPSVRWLIGAKEVPPTRLRVLLRHRTARFDSRGFFLRCGHFALQAGGCATAPEVLCYGTRSNHKSECRDSCA